MEFPHECLTRSGNRAIVFTDQGDGDRILVGAYWTGEGYIPCAWLSTGRWHPEHFTALDLLIYDDAPRQTA